MVGDLKEISANLFQILIINRLEEWLLEISSSSNFKERITTGSAAALQPRSSLVIISQNSRNSVHVFYLQVSFYTSLKGVHTIAKRGLHALHIFISEKGKNPEFLPLLLVT